MNFKEAQRARMESLIKKGTTFGADMGGGYFRKKPYPFILANAINNLYAPFQTEIIEYFRQNKVAWWHGASPTNHPLSSQIACINHLFPIRHDRDAVLEIIRQIIPDITDVLMIENDKYNPAYIQFEAISDTNHLKERGFARGKYCTSVDALAYAKHKDGRKIIIPIEWKYTESYQNENKAIGDKGTDRKKSYTDLINKSNQLTTISHDIYYYEPFYQLMRQTLWTEQIIANDKIETIKADDYVHLHVIPKENDKLLRKKYQCSGKVMEDTWRGCLKNQDKYKIITPSALLKPIDHQKHNFLLDYLRARYW